MILKFPKKKIPMHLAAALRRELVERAQNYAHAGDLPHYLGYGKDQILCFVPCEHDSGHGNFLRGSYKAIPSRSTCMGDFFFLCSA